MKIQIINIFLLFIIFFSCKTTQKGRREVVVVSNNDTYISNFSEAGKQYMLGNKAEAQELYKTCVLNNKNSDASYYMLSKLDFENNIYDKALINIESALRIDPKNYWYYSLLADIYNKTDKQVEEENVYLKMISLEHQNKDNYLKLSDIYYKQKNYQKLEDLYELIFEKFTIVNNEFLDIYNFFIENLQYERALKILKKQIVTVPDNINYHILLAELYTMQNKNYEAKFIYFDLLKKYSDNGQLAFSYAYFCKIQNDDKNFFYYIKIAFKSQDMTFTNKLSIITSGANKEFSENQFIELLGILKEIDSENPNLNNILSDYYFKTGKITAAYKFIKQAIKVDSLNLDFNLKLFNIQFQTKNFEEMNIYTTKLTEIYPNEPEVFLYQGISFFYLNKYNEALVPLQYGLNIILEQDPLIETFSVYLAETYHNLGKYNESDSYFEKILLINPSNLQAANNYAKYLAQRNVQLPKAVILIKDCLAYDKNNPVFINTYSYILLQMKDYVNALKSIEISFKIDSKNCSTLELYGDILNSLKQRENALILWNKAFSICPDNIVLQNKIKN